MSQSVISKATAAEARTEEAQTIERRKRHNRTLREFTQALPHL